MAVGYWYSNEVIRASFLTEVLPEACAQGQMHCELIKCFLESAGEHWSVHPRLHSSNHHVDSSLSILCFSGAPYMCALTDAAGEINKSFPVFPEDQGFFRKVAVHCMALGFVLHFNELLPYYGLLMNYWIIWYQIGVEKYLGHYSDCLWCSRQAVKW